MSVHSLGNRKKFASGLLKPWNMGADSVFMDVVATRIYCRSAGELAVNTFAGLLANMYGGKPLYLYACLQVYRQTCLPPYGFAGKRACMQLIWLACAVLNTVQLLPEALHTLSGLTLTQCVSVPSYTHTVNRKSIF